MRSKHDPADALADIIENADRIETYLTGMDRTAFAANGLVRDAVERCLERVCEAAHRLGERAVELMPDQPWRDIRGMGNRLRHAYDRINLDVIWNAVRHDLPGLTADARAALARLQGTNQPDEPPDQAGR
ncbi:MAG: DUF86 domain-containing protein [Acetobacteraceae bacterium]